MYSVGLTMGGGLWNYKNYPLFGDTILILSPEHAEVVAADGWVAQRRAAVSVRAGHARHRRPQTGRQGRRRTFGASLLKAAEKDGFVVNDRVRKFRSPDSILVVVSGGTAGRFSVTIPGWVADDLGSTPVSKKIAL